MRVTALLSALFLLLIGFLPHFALANEELDPSKIYYFYGQGCPHCAAVNQFFTEHGVYDRYPIEKLEIYYDRDNATLFTQVFTQLGIPLGEQGVPAIVFPHGAFYIGDKPIIDNFEREAAAYARASPESQVVSEESSKPNLTLWAVTAGALADSVNPCEFAVLILLLTAILASGSSKRALKAGLLFTLAIFLSYLAMGLGLYKALSVGNLPQYFMTVIAILAILLGLLNIKDYFWYGGGGFIMEVPQRWRPKMKSLLASVTSPAGAFLIGFLVSLFLLPCTSGPYIVILGMLAERIQFATALGYLIYYNIIFILPMIAITLLVYKGLSVERAEEIRKGKLRLLHLIAGLILAGLGVALLAGWI